MSTDIVSVALLALNIKLISPAVAVRALRLFSIPHR